MAESDATFADAPEHLEPQSAARAALQHLADLKAGVNKEEPEGRARANSCAARRQTPSSPLKPFVPVDETPLSETLKQPLEALRTLLPSSRPKSYSGLWSALKSAIGKDISKIAVPVQFNEPLSFLQRLAEDLEYSNVLDAAVAQDNSLLRLAHVAAFGSACFASSAEGYRVYKPFNPLLSETFELIRPDLGFRAVGEQVSHHPPITALHSESQRGWVLRQEYKCDTKFRGTLKIHPRGLNRWESPQGDRITWVKPQTTVHNLIFGKVWVDQEGVMDVVNHATGEKCVVHWFPYSSVGKNFTRLYAEVFDEHGAIRYTMNGGWDKGMVLYEGHVPRERLTPHPEQAMQDPNALMTVWKANVIPEQSKVMYGLPAFAMGLNQMQPNICPTDSRLRPDQRRLEDGDMEAASNEKRRLEDKQRRDRKQREAQKISYSPRWFQEVHDPETALPLHVYTGGYFDAKQRGEFASAESWPDIF
eukprot:m.103634 g.103634  ORF g.103634 m.103634 type:complete len:476 (-) comp18844_c0_seq3:87-1514(-)